MSRSMAVSPWVPLWLRVQAHSHSLKAFHSPPHRTPDTGTAGTTAVRRAGFYPTAGVSGVSGCLGTPWLLFLSLTPQALWQQGLKLITPPKKKKKTCQEIFSQPEVYCLQQVRECFSFGSTMHVAALRAISPGVSDVTGLLSYPHFLGFLKSCSSSRTKAKQGI